jgi:predicted RNase H-like nuclease (RuvC/YqgF family)
MTAKQQEKKLEPERKIIKFDTPNTTKLDEKTVSNTLEPKKISFDKPPATGADAAREELEQRRTILQNMKDFDFQIKKNQEDLTNLNEKVENLSKDLDDLVSLYEIVSEQMNPFVGLSKVTKKRIDALENFTKEVENVKTRITDLESQIEKNNVNGVKIAPPNPVVQPASIETAPSETPKSTPVNIPPPTLSPMVYKNESELTENQIDEILSKSLESLLQEQNIDTMINDFFLSLK